MSAFGNFVSNIPSPLGIGKVELANGTFVSGFIAEPAVMVMGEEDPTAAVVVMVMVYADNVSCRCSHLSQVYRLTRIHLPLLA